MNATDIRKGAVLNIDGELFVVTDFQHITPGKGQALMQTKLKSITAGNTINKRFRSTDRVEAATLETRVMEYLYQDGDSYVFMDVNTYDQVHLSEDLVGEQMVFVPPNQQVRVKFHEGNPFAVDLPASVVLEVTQTDPGHKGNSATNVFKPATLETGLVVKVPLFLSQGEKIKIDTRTGEFLERAN